MVDASRLVSSDASPTLPEWGGHVLDAGGPRRHLELQPHHLRRERHDAVRRHRVRGGPEPSWFVLLRRTVTSTPSPSAASATSAQRSALTSLRRIPAMKRSPAITASRLPRSSHRPDRSAASADTRPALMSSAADDVVAGCGSAWRTSAPEARRGRGRRTVRPRPAQQSPPESPPPAQARQLRPRCRSAVRNSFRGGGPPFHPRLRIWSGRTVRELGPGRPETADLKRFRRPRAGSGWRTVLSPIVEAGPLGAGRRPPGGAGSSSR